MMKFMKIFLLAGLMLSITNCKLQLNEGGNIVTFDKEKDIYIGDVSSMRYFNGGWYGQPGTPNFAMDLVLTVASNSLIKAQLEVPYCEVEGQVSVKDYAKIETIINNAKTRKGQSHMIDGGHNYMSLKTVSGEQRYHLNEDDSSFLELVLDTESSKELKELLEKLKKDLLSSSDCGETALASVLFNEVSVEYVPLARPIGMPPLGEGIVITTPVEKTETKSNFLVEFENGRVFITGEQRMSIGENKSCYRVADRLEVSMDFVQAAELIEIQHSELICARIMGHPSGQPYGNRVTTLVLNHRNGQSEKGIVGCEYASQARHSEKFTTLIKKAINGMNAGCSIMSTGLLAE